MISKLDPTFRRQFAQLPLELQGRARKAYRLFCDNPDHPSLEFKRLSTRHALWSVRISAGYRAVGVRRRDEIIWFFIGSHAAYDRLLAQSS